MIEYKGYQIKAFKDSPSLSLIVTAGKGGKIPDILSGLFTSTGIAKRGIDAYLNSKAKKEPANGEEISKN